MQALRIGGLGIPESLEKAIGTVRETEDDVAVSNFTDLIVWQKAMDLVVDVYQLTRTFPREERFVLTTQMPQDGDLDPVQYC